MAQPLARTVLAIPNPKPLYAPIHIPFPAWDTGAGPKCPCALLLMLSNGYATAQAPAEQKPPPRKEEIIGLFCASLRGRESSNKIQKRLIRAIFRERVHDKPDTCQKGQH